MENPINIPPQPNPRDFGLVTNEDWNSRAKVEAYYHALGIWEIMVNNITSTMHLKVAKQGL